MKQKKLVFAVVLVMLSLLLGACGSDDITKQSAYDLIRNAVEKTSKLNSYEMEMKINASTEVFGEKMETPIDFDLKVEGASGSSMKASGKMSMSILGANIDAGYYQENSVLYIDLAGTKLKISADSEEAKTFAFTDTEKNILKALPEDVVKQVTNINDDDGTRTISVMIDGEKFSEIFKELVADYSNEEAYAQQIQDIKSGVEISNANVTVTVLPNGYVGEYKVQFDMDVKLSSAAENMDFSTKVSLNASVVFKDPGTKVRVTAPSDLSEYKDLSQIK